MIAAALALVLVSQQPAEEKAAPRAPSPQTSPRANFLPPLTSRPMRQELFPQRNLRSNFLPPLETAPAARAGPFLLPI